MILEYIDSLGLINVQSVKSTYGNQYVQYLDYVLVNPGIDFGTNPQSGIDADKLFEGGFIIPHLNSPDIIDPIEDRAQFVEPTNIWDSENGFANLKPSDGLDEWKEKNLNSATASHISLVLNKEKIEFTQEDIKVEPGEDPILSVGMYLEKKIIAKIRELALESKKEFTDIVHPDGKKSIDYNEIAGDNLRRKLFSKIMTVSSAIATRSRRGPGQYVIAKREYIDLLSGDEPTSYIYKMQHSQTFSNMQLFVCNDLGDEIIVGRRSASNETGIRLISNEDSLEKNIFFNNTDIDGINIRYALDSFSPNDKNNYMSFNFKRTVFETN